MVTDACECASGTARDGASGGDPGYSLEAGERQNHAPPAAPPAAEKRPFRRGDKPPGRSRVCYPFVLPLVHLARENLPRTKSGCCLGLPPMLCCVVTPPAGWETTPASLSPRRRRRRRPPAPRRHPCRQAPAAQADTCDQGAQQRMCTRQGGSQLSDTMTTQKRGASKGPAAGSSEHIAVHISRQRRRRLFLKRRVPAHQMRSLMAGPTRRAAPLVTRWMSACPADSTREAERYSAQRLTKNATHETARARGSPLAQLSGTTARDAPAASAPPAARSARTRPSAARTSGAAPRSLPRCSRCTRAPSSASR